MSVSNNITLRNNVWIHKKTEHKNLSSNTCICNIFWRQKSIDKRLFITNSLGTIFSNWTFLVK